MSRTAQRILVAVAVLASIVASSAGAVVPSPVVTGPTVPGTKPQMFNANQGLDDLAGNGYIEEEYFFEGQATGTRFTGDGVATYPYKTRMIVRRPQDPSRFNGTVLVEWINVSAGWDIDVAWPAAQEHLMRAGYAYVTIDAQPVGVRFLRTWDPVRYGSLAHPAIGNQVPPPAFIFGDTVSDDIFSQGAMAVLDPIGVDPLGNLAVQRLIGYGASQSGLRLTAYVNNVDPTAQVFDSYLIHIGGGLVTNTTAKVLKLNSELEATGFALINQPDSNIFRYWEVAGTAHNTPHVVETIFINTIPQAFGFSIPYPCNFPLGIVPTEFVVHAAIESLNQWMINGTLPPRAPRLQFTGSPPAIARDVYGNALGGIRLPHLEVPTGRHIGVGNTPSGCQLMPGYDEFDDATLDALYPKHGPYVTKFTKATIAVFKSGFVLEADVPTLIEEAAESDIGQ